MARMVICADCGEYKPHYAKGLCGTCYQRRWRKANPRSVRAAKRRHRENHYEEVLEAERQYRQTHRDEIHSRCRRWAQAHPETVREIARRKRARKRELYVADIDEKAIFERDGYKCVYCGATENLTIDHVVALANGGPHAPFNVVTCCASCNSSKGIKPVVAWLEARRWPIPPQVQAALKACRDFGRGA